MEKNNQNICTMLMVYSIIALILAAIIILCLNEKDNLWLEGGAAIALVAISVLGVFAICKINKRKCNTDLQEQKGNPEKDKDSLVEENKKLKAELLDRKQIEAIKHDERMAVIKALSTNLTAESIAVLERLLK